MIFRTLGSFGWLRRSAGPGLVSLGLAGALLLAACGDDGVGTDAGIQPDTGPPGNTVLFDDRYDETCIEQPRCAAGTIETACACPDMPPPAEVVRVGCSELKMEGDAPRTPEDDFCDATAAGGPANLGCFMDGQERTAGTPEMITLYGVIDVFGNGGDADQIDVEVYAEGVDGALGELLGSNLAIVESPCSETEDEIDNDEVVGTRDLGFYAIENIPTETPLILKTTGALDFWRPLYTYNFVVRNDEVDREAPTPGACEGTPSGNRHRYRGRILSRSDYSSIPLTSGLTSGITTGNGAIAGEVHDCDNVRLENATVAVRPVALQTTYFTDDPSNPLPETSRLGTSKLGLYAALDINVGPVDVAAVGRVGDDIVSLGWYRAQVFPNSVSVVTMRGLRAHQISE